MTDKKFLLPNTGTQVDKFENLEMIFNSEEWHQFTRCNCWAECHPCDCFDAEDMEEGREIINGNE